MWVSDRPFWTLADRRDQGSDVLFSPASHSHPLSLRLSLPLSASLCLSLPLSASLCLSLPPSSSTSALSLGNGVNRGDYDVDTSRRKRGCQTRTRRDCFYMFYPGDYHNHVSEHRPCLHLIFKTCLLGNLDSVHVQNILKSIGLNPLWNILRVRVFLNGCLYIFYVSKCFTL